MIFKSKVDGLGQSERSMRIELDVPKDSKWTLGESGWSKKRKLDDFDSFGPSTLAKMTSLAQDRQLLDGPSTFARPSTLDLFHF